MAKRRINSRALRELAEELVHKFAQDMGLVQEEWEDFVTALVRQWITYDGNATVVTGEDHFYLRLGQTPLGRPTIVPEPGLSGWMKHVLRDWNINPEELSRILDDLNCAQSAEVVNRDGLPLRLWVNPKERKQGVEPLAKADSRPVKKRDYRKIATDELEQRFGPTLDPEEMDELACAMAKQWQQYEGHACLFLDSSRQLHFQLTELGDGGCRVVGAPRVVHLEPVLSTCGFAPQVFPEVIARINLGHQIEFRDRQGIRCRLWHDPKARRICIQPLDAVPSTTATPSAPAFCPQCTAALGLWSEGARSQACPLCGHVVRLP